MLLQPKQIKKYKGLGFVEALLSIVVAGVASVVLLKVAADTVKQLVITDQTDEMTQLAIEGSEMIRNIALKNNESIETLFPPISGNQGSCFELSPSSDNPEFITDLSGNIISKCNYDAGGRDSCKENSSLGEQYFRVFCISPISDTTTGLVVGKVLVGKVKCTESNNCDVADYEYFTLTKTKQQ